jgi:hypothetical protein
MAGGLLQLVAYGAQDVYISGNPHITFWKILYKRHTNFAMEAFRVNFTGAPAFGQRVVAVVNRNADLIGRTYLEVVLPAKDTTGTTIDPLTFWNDEQNRLGYLLLSQIEVEIGGQVIDRHYGEWLYLWECLTSSVHDNNKLLWMTSARMTGSSISGCRGRPRVLYIPLQFWFCRNPGLALPLIALQYHEVRFNITFNDAANIIRTSTSVMPRETGGGTNTGTGTVAKCPSTLDACLYIDYVYLDTEERRRFAQQSHEYLIEQLQYNEDQSLTHSSARIDLTFNHPVKELVWVFQSAIRTDCSANKTVSPFTYDDIINRGRLQLNGQDRFAERYGDYFWKVQPFQHHSGGLNLGSAANFYSIYPNIETDPAQTGTDLGLKVGQTIPIGQPGPPGKPTMAGMSMFYNPINVYSFALKPEEHQPSGTCNFSRIDNATLVFDSVATEGVGTYPDKANPFHLRMYAVSYNILRIMSGMGGLAYSN